MLRQLLLSVGLITITAGAVSAGAPMGPPSYDAREYALDLQGDLSLSATTDVNEDGDAVGVVDLLLPPNGQLASQAVVFTFENGAQLLPDVGTLENSSATAVSDRNAQGEIIIVGFAEFDPFLPTQPDGIGVYWRYSTITGQVTEMGQIGPLPGDEISRALGINNAGKIVGFSQSASQVGAVIRNIVFDVNSGQLQTFDFPATPVDINNNDQVAGARYVGDLDGNWTDLGFPPETGQVDISAINDQGWVSARIVRSFTDGNGFFVQGGARHTGQWEILWSISRFDNAKDINENGDVVGNRVNAGTVFFDDLDQFFGISGLVVSTSRGGGPFIEAASINTNRQIGAGLPASLLTPLGEMIIPGDVNGDANVDPTDLCAWLDAPVDLDGDGDVDSDDEQWLIDRLAAFGFTIDDCNGNGVPDTCDILNGTSADANGNGIPDECDDDCDGDGVPDDAESDCNGNGIPDECEIADGLVDDCNNNGIPDECDVSDTVTAGNTFAPMLPIEQNTTVTDSIQISDVGTTTDVNISLDMIYRIGSLRVLLHHAGVTATLIDQPGNGSFDNLSYDIELDDEGSGPNIQTVGEMLTADPITSPPAYIPNEALSVFDGLPREGVWELELVLMLPQGAAEAGLRGWGVEVTDEAVPVGDCFCPGDCNGDGVVNFSDLVTTLAQFGTDGTNTGCDADGSGSVNFSDLVTTLALFGSCE